MSKKLQIRNSTAEFLVFTKQAGEDTIDVRLEDETVWLTQKLIAVLFDVEVNTINYHIKEIYKALEQYKAATIRKFRIVQTEGNRQVEREVEFYNLDIIIAVGYRVNSERGFPMTMNDWAQKLNVFLQFNQREILDNPGLVTAEIAKAFAETEFEKYRVIQDQLYESDFDKEIKKLMNKY